MTSDVKPTWRAALGAASIKSKLTLFALAATLLPSLLLGWLFYTRNSDLLEEKISQSLDVTGRDQAQDVARWLTERRQELKTLASSYVVAENLPEALAGDENARLRIANYLLSVGSRLSDLDALAATDVAGQVIASTQQGDWPVPGEWAALVEAGEKVLPLGVPELDRVSRRKRFVTLLGIPVDDPDQRAMGLLVARLHFDRPSSTLRNAEVRFGDTVYVAEDSGRVIMRGDQALVALDDRLSQSLRERLSGGEMVNYWHDDGTAVVGSETPIEGIDWKVVAERRSDVAFQDISELRRLTLMLVMGLVTAIGLVAYLLSRGLTRPLTRLTAGAAQVADGDLDVSIEVRGDDEIAYLTRVFNEMVEQINAAHEQLKDQNRRLEILSSTDPLTGLYNRQHLTDRIERLLRESAERKTSFALLMMDLDHFKRLNDDHGHLAGDQALKTLADHLRHTLREDDYAARFGGEEFLILLPEHDADLAMKTAERIRRSVSAQMLEFETGKVRMTLSAGVAVYPDCGRTVDSLIQAADAALYAAKEAGRDRCKLGVEPGLRVIR